MAIHLVSDKFAGVATKHVNVSSDIFHEGVAFPTAFNLDGAVICAIKMHKHGKRGSDEVRTHFFYTNF